MRSLLTTFFLVLSAPAFAGNLENLRAMDPLRTVVLGATADVPAVAAPVPAVLPASRASAQTSNPLPNFHQVSDALYRSGQPSQSGVNKLQGYGIRTILKLNADFPAEADWAAAAGMAFETVLMSNKQSPTFEQVDEALAILKDPARQPVLVHCHLGHDRTGAVVGAYRVTVQGWSVEKAAAEARQLGYSAPGFDDIADYLRRYAAHAAGR